MSGVRIEYADQNLTLKQWAAVTGISYNALHHRLFCYKWPVEKALLTPAGHRGVRLTRNQGAQAIKKGLGPGIAEADWTVQIRLAIIQQAAIDYRRIAYREDVESFFHGRWFAFLFDLDGDRVLKGLVAITRKG